MDAHRVVGEDEERVAKKVVWGALELLGRAILAQDGQMKSRLVEDARHINLGIVRYLTPWLSCAESQQSASDGRILQIGVSFSAR